MSRQPIQGYRPLQYYTLNLHRHHWFLTQRQAEARWQWQRHALQGKVVQRRIFSLHRCRFMRNFHYTLFEPDLTLLKGRTFLENQNNAHTGFQLFLVWD